MKKDKSYFETKYKEIIKKLDSCRIEIEEISSNEKVLNSIIQVYRSTIDEQKGKVRYELDYALNGVEWDKFVIAFFGETNAGKSTTIETFRIKLQEATREEQLKRKSSGVDGAIVGDGQSDFTKDYNEYNMNVNGNPVVLIDVPGIEGNEAEFKEGIKKALSKAHCVFYVYAGNGQINEETTKKIKEYLGDWVSVYSIFNIRGGVSNYDEEEERESLKGENEKKNEKLIEKTFKKVLGDLYKGNISIQALLAMCSIAKFSAKRKDLKKQQSSLINFFGGSERIYEFSEFSKLLEVVEQKSYSYKDEIIEANIRKLQSVALSSIQTLLHISESQSKEIGDLEQHLKNFRNAVNIEFSKAERNIEVGWSQAYNSMFEYIKKRFDCWIDKGNDSDKIKKEEKRIFSDAEKSFEQDCEEVYKEQIRILSENINRQRKELFAYYKELPSLNTGVAKFSTYIDMSEAFDKMGFFNSDDAWELGGIAVGLSLAWNPIGWIIGAISIFGWGLRKWKYDKGKGKAKDDIRKFLNKAKNENKPKLSKSIRELKNKLDQKSREIQAAIKREERNVQSLKVAIENSTIELKQTIIELNI